MKKINTVVIINDFDYINGGAAKVAIDTAEALANNGMKVYFFSGVHQESDIKNSKIEYICTNQKESLNDSNKLRGAINGIYNFKAKKKLGELLKKLDREETIIHIHGWMKALSSSIFDICYKKKFKVVVTFHDYFSYCPNGGFFNYKKNEICKLKPLSIKCVVCNCDSRNYIIKLYRILRQFVQNKIVKINYKIKNIISISDFSINILKPSLANDVKIRKINNPIDIKKPEKRVDVKNNDIYIYIGRVSKEKGVELFCKAISELEYKGIVVGDGNQKEILEKKYPNILFVGWKNQEEVKEYIKGARTLIFPSLWYETAGLTALEAIAQGVPCIISDCCATKEFIKENVTGILFKANNVESLKKQIKKTKNDNFIDNLGENAYKEYWKKPFDIQRYVNELQYFYNEI